MRVNAARVMSPTLVVTVVDARARESRVSVWRFFPHVKQCTISTDPRAGRSGRSMMPDRRDPAAPTNSTRSTGMAPRLATVEVWRASTLSSKDFSTFWATAGLFV